MTTPSTPNIDLNPHDLAEVQRILMEYVPQYEVWAFGSRATWTAKAYSDLDLAIITDKPLSLGTLADLKNAFDESDLSIKVDLVDWAITAEAFQEIIRKTAVVVNNPKRRSDCEEWREFTLAELIDIKHGYAFPGEHIQNEPFGDILLTPGNFAIGGGFKADKFKYFDGAVPEEYVLQEDDLIVTMTDLSKEADTLGYPAFVPKSKQQRFLHNQRLGKVIIREGAQVDKRFLSYLLRMPEYRHEVLASATGTTVKHTSPSRILRFKTYIPPFTEQRTIAHILGTLDDKIELNRQMNETLEAMARALFKSWFVDFEPVRAKAEGRDTGLPKEIADLFPDTFEDSELGEVPKGWRVHSFSSTVEIIGGGTPKTSVAEYWDGDIPWFSVVDAPNETDVFVIDTQKKITQAGLEGSSTRLLPEGSTIISARGTVGKVALVGVSMTMNQSCYGLRSLDNSHYFAYFSTRTLIETLQQRSHGSVFDTITRDTLTGITMVVPSSPIKKAFELKVTTIMQRIRSNLIESSILNAQRDTLLPKLMSGEMRVKCVENFLQEQKA